MTWFFENNLINLRIRALLKMKNIDFLINFSLLIGK